MEVIEEAGRKRETIDGTKNDGQGKRRTSRRITKTEYPSILSMMHASSKRAQEKKMEQLVARWNAENPNATPLVLEELSDDERAGLLREARERSLKQACAYMAKQAAEDMERREAEKPDPNLDGDDLDYAYYRKRWELKYASEFGSYEDNTHIPAMCFTDKPMPGITVPAITLQIFSAKPSRMSEGLDYPLDVFDLIAVRDDLDDNRNVIFMCSRDNCQTLTAQEPYLLLTGPARAAVMEYGSLYFDAMLKGRGTTESEDQDLSLLAARYHCCCSSSKSCVSTKEFRSKLSTLELTCGTVVSSVEATISMRVVQGSWPDGSTGLFTAWNASVSHMKVLLLDSGNEKVPLAADGTVELRRHVVSVESFGELRVSAEVRQGSNKVAYREVFFTPMKAGRSHDMLDVGASKIEVTVAWSLFPIC